MHQVARPDQQWHGKEGVHVFRRGIERGKQEYGCEKENNATQRVLRPIEHR